MQFKRWQKQEWSLFLFPLFFFSSRRFRWWKFFSPLFLFSSVVECKYSRSWKLFVYIITQGNPFNSANFNKSVIVCSNLFVSKWNLNFENERIQNVRRLKFEHILRLTILFFPNSWDILYFILQNMIFDIKINI